MTARIELANLEAQHRGLLDEITAALRRVAESGCFILGPEVAAFEREFGAYCDAAQCVSCASGSDALCLALEAFGIGAGDEVIVPALTFFATAEAVCAVGARPVFVDIEEDTALLDPRQIPARLGPRTRAAVPVHLFGQVADMDPLLGLARRHGFVVIEDAAQAHGATYGGRRAGSLGHAAAFSFFPAKNLGAWGDGGAVTTNDERVASWLRLARQHGSRRKYEHEFVGRNSRLDALQAAVLRIKLRHLETWNARRAELARRYDAAFAEHPDIRPLSVRAGRRSARHQYVVRLAERDRVREHLTASGICSAVHYPSPLPLQPALERLGHVRGDFPTAERFCEQALSLPLYPELSDDQQSRVIEAVLAGCASRAAGASARGSAAASVPE